MSPFKGVAAAGILVLSGFAMVAIPSVGGAQPSAQVWFTEDAPAPASPPSGGDALRSRFVSFDAAAALAGLFDADALADATAEAVRGGSRVVVPTETPVTVELFDCRGLTFEPLEAAVRVPRDAAPEFRTTPVVEWGGVSRENGTIMSTATFVFMPHAEVGYELSGGVHLPGDPEVQVSRASGSVYEIYTDGPGPGLPLAVVQAADAAAPGPPVCPGSTPPTLPPTTVPVTPATVAPTAVTPVTLPRTS